MSLSNLPAAHPDPSITSLCLPVVTGLSGTCTVLTPRHCVLHVFHTGKAALAASMGTVWLDEINLPVSLSDRISIVMRAPSMTYVLAWHLQWLP